MSNPEPLPEGMVPIELPEGMTVDLLDRAIDVINRWEDEVGMMHALAIELFRLFQENR